MTIRRVVPDVSTERLSESRSFYSDVLGFSVAMDMGWVVTLVSPTNPTAQVTLFTHDTAAEARPQMSVEVEDVDRVYARAIAAGATIVYPITDESWGVRRFFVADPNGVIINVLTHL